MMNVLQVDAPASMSQLLGETNKAKYEAAIDAMCTHAMEDINTSANPILPSAADLKKILQDAWSA